MATPAQIEASRTNSTHSTGRCTTEGKAATGRNALKFGLFSAKNCVQSDERPEYEALSAALWKRLDPADTLEELYATEIIRASWRLRRCAAVEYSLGVSVDSDEKAAEDFAASLGDDPATLRTIREDPIHNEAFAKIQAAVDRARSQSHSVLARATAELRRLQTDRSVRHEVLNADAAQQTHGIAETKQVLTLMAAAARRHQKEIHAEAEQMMIEAWRLPPGAFAKQSRPQPAAAPQVARGAQCPCGSNSKYKRCCGRNAPPVVGARAMNATA